MHIALGMSINMYMYGVCVCGVYGADGDVEMCCLCFSSAICCHGNSTRRKWQVVRAEHDAKMGAMATAGDVILLSPLSCRQTQA